MMITNMRVNQLVKPMGFVLEHPIVSWISDNEKEHLSRVIVETQF